MAGRRNARGRRGWGQGGGGAVAGGVQGVHGAHAQTVHGRGAPMVQAAGGRGGPHTVTWVPHPDPVLGSGAPSCRRGMPLLGAAGLLGRGPLVLPVGAPQALQPASLREGAALQSYPPAAILLGRPGEGQLLVQVHHFDGADWGGAWRYSPWPELPASDGGSFTDTSPNLG